MFEIVLAAASALVWRAADFCGGKAASRDPADRRGRAMAVPVVSQLYSTPIIALFLWLAPGSFSVSALGWRAAAGIAGFFGIVLLDRSLAAGRMSVVAPTRAVTAALIPRIPFTRDVTVAGQGR